MPRRPHLPTSREIGRVLAEHAVGVVLLLLGLVLGALLRDPGRPAITDVAAWWPPAEAADYVTSFLSRLRRFQPKLPVIVWWDVLAMATLQYCMYLHGLYDRQPIRRSRNRLVRMVKAALIAGVVVSVAFFLARPPEFGRTALVIGYALTVLVLWSWRTASRRVATARPERVLVLGEGPACREAVAAAASAPPPGFVVLGRLGRPNGDAALAHLGDWSDLPAQLGRASIDRLLLASPPPPDWDLGALVTARLSGIAVGSARGFAENLTGAVLEEDIGPEFITDGSLRAYGTVSRLADVALSLLGLVVLAPLLALCAVATWLSSGRPVLFAQQRVGLGGEPYTCWKLRTMRHDAEQAGPAWSRADDPRITRVGRFLRSWRLDELPQLWNVLRGDMAFVGPRPEQPYFVERLQQSLPFYYLRHVVRPGLTGWAQVRLPYGSTEEAAREKLRHDLFYIKHRSPLLDLAILFDTVRVVLRGEGR